VLTQLSLFIFSTRALQQTDSVRMASLYRPGFLRLADGLHKRGGGERLDAPVPQADSR
jgi:hypothetical protein